MAKYYLVEVTETLQRTVVIKADDDEEAYDIADELYHDCEIELDYSDHMDTEFEVLDYEDEDIWNECLNDDDEED